MKTFTFEENILFFGLLAKIYSELDYEAPIHNWAFRVPNRELMVGNNIYRFGPARRVIDGTEHNGVQLTTIKNDLQENYFFPVDKLREVVCQLEGLKI